jgi:hypothetical protein
MYRYVYKFLSSVQAEDEWSNSCSDRIIPREFTFDSHWIGGWFISRIDMGEAAKKKFSTLTGKQTLLVQLVV